MRRALLMLDMLLAVAVGASTTALAPTRSSADESGPHDADRPRESRRPDSSTVQQRAQVDARVAEAERQSEWDHPYEQMEFRRLRMQDEYGRIPADGLQRARKHLTQMRAAQLERAKIQPSVPKSPVKAEAAGIRPSSWNGLGPSNIGGRIRSILVHPTDPSFMWIGSVGGGIFVTSDGGALWSYVPGFAANLSVSTMVFDPTNPKTMYAGTGEGFGNTDALQGAGVFKSTDTGETWTQLLSTDPTNPIVCASYAGCPWTFVNRLAISPDGTTILAATNTGCLQSTDGGSTWATRAFGPIEDVDFHPTDSTKAIYGGVGGAGYSTDGGGTWGNATFPKGTITGGGVGVQNGGRVELAYARSNPLVVYAAVDNNFGDLYKSTDGGQTYIRVNTGTNFFRGGPLFGDQGWYDNALWVNPGDATFLIVGGIDLWRSTDSGATFTKISDWNNAPTKTVPGTSVHADHHVIVETPGFNNRPEQAVFFGNDGGIYATLNVSTVQQNSGWFSLNNFLANTQLYSAVGNASTGVIVAGAQDNSTLKYHGEPQGWVPLSGAGGDGGVCAVDPTTTDPKTSIFYGEYSFLQVFRSKDGGATASYIDGGICDSGSSSTAGFVAPFVLDPNNANTMLAGGLSLWRSTNVTADTPTWVRIRGPGTTGLSAIAVAQGNPAFVVVGYNNGQVFLTQNGTAVPALSPASTCPTPAATPLSGTPTPTFTPAPTPNAPTWTNITKTLPARYVGRIVIDASKNPSWIYVGFGGFYADNLYRSTDLGQTWATVTGSGNTGLPAVPIYSLTLNPLDPDIIYAGTEVGIFISEDAGATWELPQDGPANIAVEDLTWMGTDLLAATHGRGLYRASGNPGLFVDCNAIGRFQDGSYANPFKTITAAINAASPGEEIWIAPCTYNEPPLVNMAVQLHSLPGGAVVINPSK